MPPEKKVRTSPRLSLSKLAEFLTASPLRQRSILVEQKFPKSYVTARYTPAEGAIARFLQTGDAAVIDDATATLEAAGAGTEWEADQNRLCAEAISAFLDVADDVLGRGLVFERSENHVPSIAVAGVDVSVRPELLARDGDRRVRGAVKLYFSKSHPLGDDGGAYATALLHHWSSTAHVLPGTEPGLRACVLVDVFAGRVYEAPKAYKQRLKNVGAACQTIAAVWPTLSDNA